MAQASPTLARSPEPARLNLSWRALRITAPRLQGDINLGDVDMMVAPDDTISLPTQRLLDLMATVVEPKTMDTLRSALSGLPSIAPGDLAGTGVSMVYDLQALSLRLTLPDTLRAARSVQLGSMSAEPAGTFDQPADVSAYVDRKSTRLNSSH